MHLIFRAFILQEGNLYTEALAQLDVLYWIAVDDGGHAMHEYDECCRPKGATIGLRDWLAERFRLGLVREVEMDRRPFRYLAKEYGLPEEDVKWVAIAYSSDSQYILTEDIDLFDPKKKALSGAARLAFMKNGSGAVRKCVRKRHNIEVLCTSTFCEVCTQK